MSQEKKKTWWKRINQEWLPEILALIILIIGAIYFILPVGLKSNLFTPFQSLFFGIVNLIEWLFTPSTILGIIILITGAYFLIKRLRYHLIRLANQNPVCPVCQSRIHKRHRKKYQYFLSYIVPIRRYCCSNCGWDGLRVYNPSNRGLRKKKN